MVVAEILGNLFGVGAVELIKSLAESFAKKTGEKVGKQFQQFVAIQWGVETEDERRVTKALRDIPYPENGFLLARLGKFSTDPAKNQKIANYYRTTIMDDDVAEITRTLMSHAVMTATEWVNHCAFMGYNDKALQMQTQYEKFMDWLKGVPTIIKDALVAAGVAVKDAAVAADNFRQAVSDSIADHPTAKGIRAARLTIFDKIKDEL